MDTRGGKDDIAGNVAVGAVLLALTDLSLDPLIVWLAPSVLTSLTRGASSHVLPSKKKGATVGLVSCSSDAAERLLESLGRKKAIMK
jgi:hypothetical protein